MSCAYRSHRYRASVTADPASVSWGHAQHPIPLRPPVVRPNRQAVMATTDDAPIPVSLVQYLWSQWQESPPDVRDAVTDTIGELMLSPRWHWDVTVLPEHAPTDPSNPCVIERDGRPTIGIPITMLRDLWTWVVLRNTGQRAPILRRFASGITPSLWQELRTHQPAHGLRLTEKEYYRLYGYLSPVLLPDIAHTTRHLLASADPADHQMALTMLDRWMASDDHATRDLAAQMLRAWLNDQAAASPTDDRLRLRALTILASDDDPAVVSTRLDDLLRTARNRIARDDVRTVIDLLHRLGDGRSLAMDRWMSLIGEMVRDHPSDDVIREVLDGLIPAIVPSARLDDRVRWVTTLWDLMTDSTLADGRRLAIATALTSMMQDPMVATLVHAQLCTGPSLPRTIPASICDTLLEGLIHTAHADAVLRMIAQEIRQDRNAVARFDPIVAAGWGHGHDHRILQMVTAHPSPHWCKVLTEGVTTSVGAEVCDRIRSWFPHNQAIAMIVDHIEARERRGDWPLVPLPAYLIPWVCKVAHTCPSRLHPTTIRRLWLADPKRAWDVTQTMLWSRSSHSSQWIAIAAMDTGWGTGHDAAMATILRSIILNHRSELHVVTTGTTTAVAGIGIAPSSLIAPLLTELATTGHGEIQSRIVRTRHRGWERGQDVLGMRILEIIAKRKDSPEWIWNGFHETLAPAWDHLPSHVVVSLIDRLVTHGMHRLANEADSEDRVQMGSMAEAAIAAFAPIWTHLPTPQVIDRIAHHVAYLHAHAHTLAPSRRNKLVDSWASVIAAGAERLSVSDIRAVLDPLWDLSPHGCLHGILQWVGR
jgi:hypothetical protein